MSANRKRPPAKGASPRASEQAWARTPKGKERRGKGAESGRRTMGSGRPSPRGRSVRDASFDAKSSQDGKMADAREYSRNEAAERLRSKRRSDLKAHDNKIILIGAAAFVGVIVIVSLVMSWNMWWRYDDAADVQGTWTVEGSDNTVRITDSAIYLTDTLFYDYTLDTESKRIVFTFEDKKGEGVYSFSDDRNTLTIAEENASSSSDSDPSIYTTLVRSSGDASQ